MERLGADAFQGEKLGRPGDWGVCFLADWCPFCRAFLPQFQKLEGKTPFSLAIGDVTDLDSPLWDAFHLDVVPTLVAFREGAPVWRKDGVHMVGLKPRDLDELIQALAR